MYALHTWGELCLSPIGLSLVNKLAPFKFASLLMAVWFLANAAANKLAGVLSALYPDNGKTTSFLGFQMHNLYDFFLLFTFMAGTASLILFPSSAYRSRTSTRPPRRDTSCWNAPSTTVPSKPVPFPDRSGRWPGGTTRTRSDRRGCGLPDPPRSPPRS